MGQYRFIINKVTTKLYFMKAYMTCDEEKPSTDWIKDYNAGVLLYGVMRRASLASDGEEISSSSYCGVPDDPRMLFRCCATQLYSSSKCATVSSTSMVPLHRGLYVTPILESIACGIIARSAGVFQNPKRICQCDGVVVWEEQLPYYG